MSRIWSKQNKSNQTLITMKNLIPTNQPQHQPIKLEKACLTLFVIISYASLWLIWCTGTAIRSLAKSYLTLSSTGQGSFNLEFLLNHILSAEFFSNSFMCKPYYFCHILNFDRADQSWVCHILGANPVWHGIGKQEKVSCLEQPRSNFFKT